jgi:hypothetical protein
MSDEDSGFPKTPEKRHYQRIDLELPVEIEVDGRKLSATTGNVSCGGMYLPNLQSDFKEAQGIVTFINLPSRSEAIRLNAKITRVENEAAAGGVAVEFDGLYDDNRLEMDRYLKWKLLN